MKIFLRTMAAIFALIGGGSLWSMQDALPRDSKAALCFIGLLSIVIGLALVTHKETEDSIPR